MEIQVNAWKAAQAVSEMQNESQQVVIESMTT